MSVVQGAAAFWAACNATQREVLQGALQDCCERPPSDWIPWFCADPDNALPAVLLGVLSPQRASWLQERLPACRLITVGDARHVHWRTLTWPEAARSAALQKALELWNRQGRVHGWRDEAFAFWTHATDRPPVHGAPLLRVERAGYRFLGMPSHAVHINGFTPDGRLWCGRRAMSKATDPGMLDNVTAGGLPAQQSPWDCALRELQEEAGATLQDTAELVDTGTIRTARQDTGGWHEETLLVYNWHCPPGWTPANQDGEVSEFVCLRAPEVVQRLAQGQFTRDAAASLAHGLGLTHEAATISPRF